MSERKVLNKYYPPDFDPSVIAKRKKTPKGTVKQITVRLMAPFSMRCDTCGEFIYKGKKFNSRKEDAKGEKYHSIQIFRFYIRCPKCAAEITFKTDPKNLDYACEHGAKRNFEPWREEAAAKAEAEAEAEAEALEHNPIKALEARTEESRREMEILDALDELRTRNARAEKVDVDEVLDRVSGDAEVRRRVLEAMEEDDAAAAAAFRESMAEAKGKESMVVATRDQEEEGEGGRKRKSLWASIPAAKAGSSALSGVTSKRTKVDLGIVSKASPKTKSMEMVKPVEKRGGALSSMLAGYSSSDDE